MICLFTIAIKCFTILIFLLFYNNTSNINNQSILSGMKNMTRRVFFFL